MKNILCIFRKVLFILLIALIFWILENAILNYDTIIYSFNPIYVVVGILAYIAALVFVQKKMISKLSNLKFFNIAVFILFFIVSIIVGLSMRVNPSWDMGEVFNIAKHYATNNQVGESTYLISYPNNIMITRIYIGVFKFTNIFGLTDYISIATIFNACIITATAILTYYIAKMMYDKEKATLVLLILFFTTPLYLHAAIYYTDSISMLFSTLILFLFLLNEKSQNKWAKVLIQVLLGISIVISWKVKITGAFIAIAIFVFRCITKFDKKILKRYLIVVPTILVTLIGYTLVFEKKMSTRDDAELYKMPWQHWIVLGLTGNGGFNQQIYEFTCMYPTYSEKKEADVGKIKEIIKGYNCNEFIKHLTEKLKYAWTDGTYFAPEKLRRNPVEESCLQKFVFADGEYSKYYKYFPQVMHLGLLVLIIFSCLKDLKNNKLEGNKTILVISILGLMMFLMIWENRSRYILTMFPIYVLLGVDGIKYVGDILSSKMRKIKVD